MLQKENKANSIVNNAICLTFKINVPKRLYGKLESLLLESEKIVKEMLKNRDKKSTKYYKTVPSIVAKGLASKYQKNKKCKKVSRLVIHICGDKGKQVKSADGGIRIPGLFKKDIIKIPYPRPISGFIRQVEFFKRGKEWIMSYSYNTPILNQNTKNDGFIGVDRNSVGNVATIATSDGITRHLGPCSSGINKNFKNRIAKLQKKGAKKNLKKLKGKQANRTRDINHKVSRSIVNLAVEHCSAIVLEDLSNIAKTGKAKRYVQKSQWSFYQLETFIKYKAALHGIPVYYVSARYTSQECNKCGSINKPNGKTYRCLNCGHVAHRDVNAALNILSRAGQGTEPKASVSGYTAVPQNQTVYEGAELKSLEYSQ